MTDIFELAQRAKSLRATLAENPGLSDLYEAGRKASADPLRRGLFGVGQFGRALMGANPDEESYRQAGFNQGMLDRANSGKVEPLRGKPWEQEPFLVHQGPKLQRMEQKPVEQLSDQRWREAQEAIERQKKINALSLIGDRAANPQE